MSRPMMLSTVFMVVACATLLIGCSKNIVGRDVRSPDGRLTLRIEINESGGAAVPDVTSAFILPFQSAEKELIFRGSAISHFNANWKSSERVVLSFDGGYVTTCNAAVVVPPNLKITVQGCK